ncbi:MAG: type II secretion system F family protein [Candidatus Korobacteraceae bacterium]
MHPLLQISIVVTAFFANALVIILFMLRPSRQAKRVFDLTRDRVTYIEEPKKSAMQNLSSIFRLLRTKLGLRDNQKLRERFVAAGLRSPSDADFYFGIRLLGPLAALVGASFIPTNTAFWMIGGAALAFLAPDIVLTEIIRHRREKIRLGMPDAIDLLVICVEAGLGLDQALLRSGQELALSHPPIAEEFTQINLEQRAGKGRIEAWRSMGDRTKLDVIKAFTGMLAQTDRFGTPIAKALITFSDGMRMKRRQQAEEMAAKTTVKLIFPLVLFIFPSIFIVLLGPAMITIVRSLDGGVFK